MYLEPWKANHRFSKGQKEESYTLLSFACKHTHTHAKRIVTHMQYGSKHHQSEKARRYMLFYLDKCTQAAVQLHMIVDTWLPFIVWCWFCRCKYLAISRYFFVCCCCCRYFHSRKLPVNENSIRCLLCIRWNIYTPKQMICCHF